MRHGIMREHNLAVLLQQVRTHQPVTRARLAGLTGFTKTTVSNLITVLAEAGLVRDGDLVHEAERGRPGVAVVINPDGGAGLGLEINVDYLAACVLDLNQRVRYRHLVATDNRARHPEEVVAALSKITKLAIESAADLGLDIAGAVVAVPGVVDGRKVLRAPNLGWSDVPVADMLRAGLPELRLGVEQDNEANLAALGELWFGAGAALGDFLHVSGEIGIGAGVVVGGRLFRGAHGFAGEFGHVVVVPDGVPCRCGGRGCLERYAGQDVLLGAAPDLAALRDRLAAGDPRATAACRAAGEALGVALTSAVHLLDPDTIVLGGVFAALFTWLRDPVAETMTSRLTRMRGVVPRLTRSQAGPDAATLGAAGSVIMRIIADPAAFLAEALPA